MEENKDIFSSKKKENEYKKGLHVKKKNVDPKTKRNIVIALILTGVLTLTSTVVGIVSNFAKKNNTNQNSKPNTSSSQNVDTNVNDLGMELEFPKESKPTYGNTTGNVDKDKVVEKDGKYYKDQENADKTSSIGSSSTTSSNQKQEFEIKDETGKVVEKGEGKIPNGYAWDSVLKKYLPKEEVGKYAYADVTYYDETGDIVINKGEIVSKESLEFAKKYCTTKKPNNNTSSNTSSSNSSSNSTSSSNKGVVNKDGTYTIFGLTFESKADYEQWIIQGYEGYVEIDGIMKSETELTNYSQMIK